MRALDYVRGRMSAMLAMGFAAAAAGAPMPMPTHISYPQTRQRPSRAWQRTHGFSGAKLARRAAAGTVGLARLK